MINSNFSYFDFSSYEDFLYPPAPIAQIGPDAQHVVYSITDKTSPKEFDKLCEKYPNYNIETTCNTCDQNRIGFTALHNAIDNRNLELTAHIVKKFGKRIINLLSLDKISPLHAALYCNVKSENKQNKEKIVELLIKSGAEINCRNSCFGTINPFTAKTSTVSLSTLDLGINFDGDKNINIRIVKLLIQYGAQELVSFNSTWKIILNELCSGRKNIKLINKYIKTCSLITEQFHEKLQLSIMKEAKRQIHEEKFNFFSGLKDANSSVSNLPKEIVAIILTYEQILTPNIRKKAEKLLAIAKFKTVYENEALFFCGHRDERSIINFLPRNVFDLILKTIIALNNIY